MPWFYGGLYLAIIAAWLLSGRGVQDFYLIWLGPTLLLLYLGMQRTTSKELQKTGNSVIPARI